jgi:thiamine kinase-like enzyme
VSDVLTIDDVIAGVPAFSGREVAVEPIEGGLTNLNYRLTVDGGERFCVRIPGRDSSLLAVDRQVEWKNTVAAASSGVGARVVHVVGALPVMVLEWIDGVVQSSESLREDASLPKMAAACRRLHAGPPFVNRFDMFRIAAGYLDLVRERGFRIPDTYADHLPAVRRIEEAMAVRGAALVPCNNDLLAANYIDTGDGFRLIDYEYSGMNDPCFELGNTWAESELSPDQLAILCEHYFGERLANRVARARLWSIMSNYGWTLWAAIQHAVSDIDFDFWEWGIDGKFARAEAAFADPGFGRLLDDVRRTD